MFALLHLKPKWITHLTMVTVL